MLKPSLTFQKSPALPFVEFRHAVDSSACYHTHTHDEFSFGLIDEGTASYQNRDRTYRIKPGTLVTINPGEPHSCNPDSDSWSYRMVFVDADWLGQAQQDIFNTIDQHYFDFRSEKVDDPKLAMAFNRLFTSLLNINEPLAAETNLLELIANLFPELKGKAEPPVHNTELAKEFILDDLKTNHCLDDLARRTGLSRYHFIRSFKAQHGQTPHAFQLDSRVKRAKLQLQEGESLAEVALSLGFADQAHFQRHFKKRVAVTPKQYQELFNTVSS